MDLQATFATDKKKEQDGVWKNLGDARVKIARANNPKYRTALTKYIKQFVPAGIQPKPDDPNIEKATVYAMAEAILLDWENLAIKGEILEVSVEQAIGILTDYPDFREVISQLAIDVDNFRPDEIAEK
jgi:hypothetical protein